MRAALLPAGPDPFLIADWLRHFEHWSDEMDELRILVLGSPDTGANAWLAARLPPKVEITFRDNRLEHGSAIRELLNQTTADHVMLCEDDAFIRRPGSVDAAFREVEEGRSDIVGSPRYSVAPEIAAAAEARFGTPPVTASGESGHSLWPCFLFAKRDLLLSTDGNFGSHGWPVGELSPELHYIPQAENAGDTFVHATYQLRDAGARIAWRPQYRADLDKMDEWLTQDPPWFHVGSLSAGYGYVFLGPADGSFERIAREVRKDPWDWHKRVAWWQRSLSLADGLPEQRERYVADLERFTQLAGLQRKDIARWAAIFAEWVTW